MRGNKELTAPENNKNERTKEALKKTRAQQEMKTIKMN